jgi:xanthine dehydrogenase accessory factor
MTQNPLSHLTVCIKGAGEMASGVACRLHAANLTRILMLEAPNPLAVRRKVSLSEKARAVGGAVLEAIMARFNQ